MLGYIVDQFMTKLWGRNSTTQRAIFNEKVQQQKHLFKANHVQRMGMNPFHPQIASSPIQAPALVRKKQKVCKNRELAASNKK